MLRSVFLKALRDQRWWMLGWGIVLGLVVFFDITEYREFSGSAQQVADLGKLYQSFGFLIGEYVPVDTLGGFLTLEIAAYLPVVLGVWAAAMAVSGTRGEEEVGALDLVLTAPRSRLSVLGQKIAAMVVSLVVALTVLAGFLWAAVVSANETLPAWGVAGLLLNIFLASLFWGALGLLIAQLVQARRTASMTAGGIVVGAYFLNSIVDSVGSWKFAGWVVPFHYYSMSKPLVPGRSLDPVGIAVLALATVVVAGIATWMFVRRDTGAGFAIRAARATQRERLPGRRGSLAMLGSMLVKGLRDQAVSTLVWSASLAVYIAVIVATTKEVLGPLQSSFESVPFFNKLFGSMATNEAYLSVVVFYYFPLLMAIFALLQVWNWASDEEEGRLEVLAAEPIPRWKMLLARYVPAVVSMGVVLSFALLSLLVTANITGIAVDTWKIAGGVLAVVPTVLVCLAFGLALATWLARPLMAVVITGGLLVAMFFLGMLAPLFDWPDAVRRLSVFEYYGKPVVDGVPWGDLTIVTVAALVFGMLSFVGLNRRDIAK